METIMPTESVRISELNGKRKIKNKVPKRLRRKNKPIVSNNEGNLSTDHTSLTKEKIIQESDPLPLNPSSSNTDNNPTINDTSTQYWRCCTKKAMDILEKQAITRRKFLIERHQERIDSIQGLLQQREQIDKLNEENYLISQSLNSVHNDLRTKDETIKTLEDKLYDYNDLIRDNDYLRVQLKLNEQKFDRFTIEYSKKVEENRQHEHESNEQIQSLMDEIERIKRDLVLEEYRKQEAERKVRYYDEKTQIEQNLNKKMQQDIIQLKQELKSIHTKYDSLQIEMLAMHKANNNDISLIPTKDTNENEWTNKRAINHEIDEQFEVKRSKRKTRDRTESSASTTSSCSDKRNKQEIDNNNPSLSIKRKTKKSNKIIKKYLPMVTVTQASPSIDQTLLVEKDSSQLLIPSSISATSDATDSHDTSSESQTLKSRTKKQSRYPCRRAQRPVKQIDTINQV